ncbi:MAG: Uxx-star family glutaredoxin-like (seleno)protein [Candidatus Korobacteraceae bacterium]
MATLELFGTASCPYTQEMREWLEWKRSQFVEYDVEEDLAARDRLLILTHGQSSVPVLVEDGKVVQVGWQGRACVVDPAR